jgi:hypothetical protein
MSPLNVPDQNAPDLCLIVEPLRIVAKDLAATLRDATGCHPVLASSPAEALTVLGALPPESRVTTAFVHLSARAFADSPLKPILEHRGARIVLTGAPTEPDGGQANLRANPGNSPGTNPAPAHDPQAVSGPGPAPGLAFPWPILPRPFATADVLQALGLAV